MTELVRVEEFRARLGGWANMMFARYGHPVWLVGSVVEGKSEPTDIDLRIVLPDDEFIGRFGDYTGLRSTDRAAWSEQNIQWAATVAKETRWLAARTGINADFKIRSESWYAERHASKPRIRLDNAALSHRTDAGGEALEWKGPAYEYGVTWGPETAPPPDRGAALREALEPFTKEIDRLEREFGFDRPDHQYQPLMIPLGDIKRLRAAISDGRA